MDINNMTRADFLALPQRKWNEKIKGITSLVILPMRHKHGSGYACMDFVGASHGSPICRLSGCSDVINIGNARVTSWPGWSIDCLYKSKLLHLWANEPLIVGPGLSSFDVRIDKGD